MEGNAKVIEALNEILTAEMTSINQYFVHAKMCENWGYQLLYEDTEERAMEEMKHAEKLIDRILYLEGIPIVTKLDKINVGKMVKDQFENDYALEKVAIQRLQKAIKLCIDLSDGGSRELLEHILLDEEDHANDLEAYLQQIKDMGVENFLTTQVHEKGKS
ncbi:MAG: bacterioferritin [Planctomycetota bacterium]|nr:bacterioferritin [Planctomycetota bacterium]MDE1889380.1 bacterioferritin [Planctomycetota bacterium]MDE2217741.1 bacterioferritin [Planctomycetota bacterium]